MHHTRARSEIIGTFLATSSFGIVASLLLIALTGCDDGPTGNYHPGKPEIGDTQFVSAAPNGGGDRLAGAVDDGDTEASGGEEREIEEADIIRVDGDLLYVLNAYRGLHIIDIENPDAPNILGNAKVFGYPVEMYIDGTRAYIVVSNYFSYWQSLTEDSDAEEWRGSQIVIVDIQNPANPQIMSAVNIEGYISNTRRVGEVLYVVSNRYAWWSCDASDDSVNLTFAASINILDPDDIHEVGRINFPGSSNFIHVTQNALFIAQYHWDWDATVTGNTYGSEVTYVDISDPMGAIAERDSVFVPGYLRDRFAMDWYQDSFRIVTHFWEGIGHSELRTFNTLDPDNLTPQGVLPIEDAGRLMATRFDGDRAYTIHLPQAIDPLDVIDLSDPTNPTLEAILEIPGWVNHLEARGNRLIALGVDDTAWPRRVSVKLFDVTNAQAPLLLAEAPIGEGQSWSQANWDPKALTVLDDEGLILVPFNAWEEGANDYTRGVALVSWIGDSVQARGVMTTSGYVNRTRSQNGRVLAVSAQHLEVFDAADLDNPVETASIELAWNVSDFVTIGDYGVQLVGDYWWYYWYDDTEPPTRELRVVPLDDPDIGPVVATVELQAPFGRMFQNGNLIYVASYDYQTDNTTVEVFDFTDPTQPVARGSIELDMPGGFDYWGGIYGYWSWWYYGGGEVVQMGDRLIFHPQTWWWWYYEDAVGDGSGDAAPQDVDAIWVVDLGDPDAPVSARVGLDRTASQVNGHGDTVYYTYWEPVEMPNSDFTWAAYYLGRLDVSIPAQPVEMFGVNIPGQFVDASDNGSTIYTLDTVWDTEGSMTSSFNALKLNVGNATLLGRLDVTDSERWVSGLRMVDDVAHMTLQDWGWYYDCGRPPAITYRLIDARTPTNLSVASEFVLTGYGHLLAVENNRSFLNTGWGDGLVVLDVNDITAPSLLGSYRTQGYPVGIRLTEDTAYLPSGYYGVQAFQLSDGTPIY